MAAQKTPEQKREKSRFIILFSYVDLIKRIYSFSRSY